MAIETCKIEGTGITWTDIVEPTPEELKKVSEEYNLNSYTLFDSMDPDHLPKYEEHNDTHFIIVRILQDDNHLEQTIQSLSTKIAIFYNDDFIITIHRSSQPFIKNIRENYISNNKIHTSIGIAIRIVRDALYSFEYPIMKLSDEIDLIESQIFLKNNMAADLIKKIYHFKSRSGIYKKLLLLSNEVVSFIKVDADERPALSDVRDLHTKLLMLNDQIQDDANNLLNIYLSLSARKTNDVMKVLTVFSVFFMPLTFVVGIYGMNFRFMPELGYKWGYPFTLLCMLIMSIIIFIWFKRKKWL